MQNLQPGTTFLTTTTNLQLECEITTCGFFVPAHVRNCFFFHVSGISVHGNTSTVENKMNVYDAEGNFIEKTTITDSVFKSKDSNFYILSNFRQIPGNIPQETLRCVTEKGDVYLANRGYYFIGNEQNQFLFKISEIKKAGTPFTWVYMDESSSFYHAFPCKPGDRFPPTTTFLHNDDRIQAAHRGLQLPDSTLVFPKGNNTWLNPYNNAQYQFCEIAKAPPDSEQIRLGSDSCMIRFDEFLTPAGTIKRLYRTNLDKNDLRVDEENRQYVLTHTKGGKAGDALLESSLVNGRCIARPARIKIGCQFFQATTLDGVWSSDDYIYYSVLSKYPDNILNVSLNVVTCDQFVLVPNVFPFSPRDVKQQRSYFFHCDGRCFSYLPKLLLRSVDFEPVILNPTPTPNVYICTETLKNYYVKQVDETEAENFEKYNPLIHAVKTTLKDNVLFGTEMVGVDLIELLNDGERVTRPELAYEFFMFVYFMTDQGKRVFQDWKLGNVAYNKEANSFYRIDFDGAELTPAHCQCFRSSTAGLSYSEVCIRLADAEFRKNFPKGIKFILTTNPPECTVNPLDYRDMELNQFFAVCVMTLYLLLGSESTNAMNEPCEKHVQERLGKPTIPHRVYHSKLEAFSMDPNEVFPLDLSSYTLQERTMVDVLGNALRNAKSTTFTEVALDLRKSRPFSERYSAKECQHCEP